MVRAGGILAILQGNQKKRQKQEYTFIFKKNSSFDFNYASFQCSFSCMAKIRLKPFTVFVPLLLPAATFLVDIFALKFKEKV